MDRVRAFITQPLKHHIVIATFIRLALISYGTLHDRYFDVPYTDVDYKVFTDAGRHVFNGKSPYKRHTYRYSPVIAYLMVPNLFWKEYGKVLFCVFDVLITIAVKTLVEHQLGKNESCSKSIAMYASLFWLYNPMSIAISTRGNADSVPCFFIVLSLLFLQTDVVKSSVKYALSGIFLGISIHLRLYPLAFSFPMYLSLGRFEKGRVTFKEVLYYIIIPNKKQLLLALSCVITLVSLTYFMYFLYGYEFIFETYLYHLFRKDTKHNFSVLFYYSYLTMDQLAFDGLKAVTQFLEFIILFVLSLTFGCDPKTLPFGLFCQTVVLVAYNSVLTSQYFIWFLSLLPLVVHSIDLNDYLAMVLCLAWMLPQACWLFFAYLLEFKGSEVFFFVWVKCLLFFCVNIFVLCAFIKSYSPGYGFGMVSPVQTVGKVVKQT